MDETIERLDSKLMDNDPRFAGLNPQERVLAKLASAVDELDGIDVSKADGKGPSILKAQLAAEDMHARLAQLVRENQLKGETSPGDNDISKIGLDDAKR